MYKSVYIYNWCVLGVVFMSLLKEEEDKLIPQNFLKLAGKVPTANELEVETVFEEEFDDYKRRLIRYTVFENEKIEAYVLLPKRRIEKSSAILAIHGEGRYKSYKYGKSDVAGITKDKELNIALELCQRGNVIICPDRFPYESRNLEKSDYREKFTDYKIFPERNSDSYVDEYYRICACNKALYEGYTELGKELMEMKAAVDILADVPESDESRIGVIGLSEGGILGILTMFLDSRIKAGCCINAGKLLNRRYDGEEVKPLDDFDIFLDIPGMKKYGGVQEIMAEVAPRPFLLLENEKNVSSEAVESFCKNTKERYFELNVPQKFSKILYYSAAYLPDDIRFKAYQWLEKSLKK